MGQEMATSPQIYITHAMAYKIELNLCGIAKPYLCRSFFSQSDHPALRHQPCPAVFTATAHWAKRWDLEDSWELGLLGETISLSTPTWKGGCSQLGMCLFSHVTNDNKRKWPQVVTQVYNEF